jgi:hypothetical protein
MKKFNKKQAADYLDKLLQQQGITVVARSKSSCGWADVKRNEIKIPFPTTIDRFGVCLHEVKHCIDKNKGKRYEQEFWADKFALDILKAHEYDTQEWENRMRWHVLSRTAMATNRGCEYVSKEVRDYFSDIDIQGWIGKKVFVSPTDKKCTDIKISIELK